MDTPYAFVSLVTSDRYLPGALAVAAALKELHPKPPVPPEVAFQTLCLVTPETVDVSTIKLLRRAYDIVIGVEVIEQEDGANLQLLGRPDLNQVLTKLHIFRLAQYAKIIFLDADVLPIRPMSHLFTLPHEFSAVPDVGWPDIFNSGVLVLAPGEDKFKELVELHKTKGSWDGGDQGLLNEWRGGNWNRLSFTYNTTPTAAYTYAPAYERFGSQISAIHFIGPSKPWATLTYRPPGTKHASPRVINAETGEPSPAYDYASLVDRWYEVYDRHYRNENSSDHGNFEWARYDSAWDSGTEYGAEITRPQSTPPPGGALGLEDLRKIAVEGISSYMPGPPGRPQEGEYRSLPLEGRVSLMRPRKGPEQITHEGVDGDHVKTPMQSHYTPHGNELPRMETLPTPGPEEIPPAPYFHGGDLPPTTPFYPPHLERHEPSPQAQNDSRFHSYAQSQQSSSGPTTARFPQSQPHHSLQPARQPMRIPADSQGGVDVSQSHDYSAQSAGEQQYFPRIVTGEGYSYDPVTGQWAPSGGTQPGRRSPGAQYDSLRESGHPSSGPRYAEVNYPEGVERHHRHRDIHRPSGQGGHVAPNPRARASSGAQQGARSPRGRSSPSPPPHARSHHQHHPPHAHQPQRRSPPHPHQQPHSQPHQPQPRYHESQGVSSQWPQHGPRSHRPGFVSPPKVDWNPALEPPPKTPPPPSAFPQDTYFPNIWDQPASHHQDATYQSQHNPGPASDGFFNPPPPAGIPEQLLKEGQYENVIGRLESSPGSPPVPPAPDRNKVHAIFPWEEKPRHVPRRIFPESDSPPPAAQFVEDEKPPQPRRARSTDTRTSGPSHAQSPPIGLPGTLTYSNAWDTVPSIQKYASKLVRPHYSIHLPQPPPPAPDNGWRRWDKERDRQYHEQQDASSMDGDDEDDGDDDDDHRGNRSESSPERGGRSRSGSTSSSKNRKYRTIADVADHSRPSHKDDRSPRGLGLGTPSSRRWLAPSATGLLPPLSMRELPQEPEQMAVGTPSVHTPHHSTMPFPSSASPTGLRSPQTLGSPRSYSPPKIGTPLKVSSPPSVTSPRVVSPTKLSGTPPRVSSPKGTLRGPIPRRLSSAQQVPRKLSGGSRSSSPAVGQSSSTPPPATQSPRLARLSASFAPPLLRTSSEDTAVASSPSTVGPVATPESTTSALPATPKGSRVWDPARGVDVFKRTSEEVLARFLRTGSFEEEDSQRRHV